MLRMSRSYRHRPDADRTGSADVASRPHTAEGLGNQALLAQLKGAEGAFEDPTVPLPHRASFEAAFGRSFAKVRCHIGPRSQAMGAKLGFGGVARGWDVAFAEEAPDASLVAHELAHVVQQAGGAALPGAQDAETDADLAAAAAVAGRPVEVRQRTPVSVRYFTGDEHVEIGNQAAKKALANVGLSDSHARLKTKRADGKTLSYGQASRQGADKYDTVREFNIGLKRNDKEDFADPDSDLSKKDVIKDNGNIAGNNVSEVKRILSEAKNEGYDKDNFGHTWKVNKLEWSTFHAEAISLAARGKLQRALRSEAFAAHFLQDAHAAGHFVPRSVEQAAGGSRLREPGSGVSWHDYFNEHGVPTTKGILYGDEFLHKAPVCVMRATRASLEEVLQAYKTGNAKTSKVGGRFPEPLTDPAELANMQKPTKRMDGKKLTVTDAGYDARADGLVPKFLEMLAAHQGLYETLQAQVASGQEEIETPAGHTVSADWLVSEFGDWFDRV